MIRVKLIAWSSANGLDPRRLVVLAVKTSTGDVRKKGIEHYLLRYPDKDVSSWVIKAVDFPNVFEHITFTFMIEGISRVTSHQLVRHRIASYTQESQRYSQVPQEYVIPKTISDSSFKDEFKRIVELSFSLYEKMVKAGIPYEDARYILPQAVTTNLLMTVNLRELIHIACLRLSPKAQWEIRELVRLMIKEASKVIPELPEIISRTCGFEVSL